MTSTKRTQRASKGKGTREALKARAAEIVADVRGFDADTRRGVHVALSNMNFAETNQQPRTKYTSEGYCERELREAVRKAEAGAPFFDVKQFKPEAVEQARAVYRMLEPRDSDLDLPDFITDAVIVALEVASERYDAKIWLDVDGSGDMELGGFSVAAFAHLFERARFGDAKVEPAKDLAGLIAAVLGHADTPTRIYNALSEAVADLASKDEVQNRPEVIRATLEVYKATEEGGGDE